MSAITLSIISYVISVSTFAVSVVTSGASVVFFSKTDESARLSNLNSTVYAYVCAFTSTSNTTSFVICSIVYDNSSSETTTPSRIMSFNVYPFTIVTASVTSLPYLYVFASVPAPCCVVVEIVELAIPASGKIMSTL